MGRGVTLLIVAKLHERVQLMPHFRVVGAKDSEVDFELLIDSFCFSISLRVVSGTSEHFYSKESHDFTEYLRGKLWSSIREEGIREAKSFEHMFSVI